MRPEPMTDTVTIDNPGYEPGNPESIRKIDATRSLRDNPLRRLHARGHISDDEYEAGRIAEAAYESAQGRVRASDPTREYVDGGGAAAEALTARQQDASKRIARIKVVLGIEGEKMLRAILAERKFPGDIAKENGKGEREERHYSWLFRGYLRALAVEFHLRAA